VANGLIEDLRAALEEAARTPRGQKALHGHDEDFDLEIAGHDTVHVAIAGGQMEVSEGPSPRRQPLHYTLVQVDEPTLRTILAGRISPVEAMEAGRLFLRTRLYGGALITILLRAAYDLARSRKLEVA
jgi:hypothetical protein